MEVRCTAMLMSMVLQSTEQRGQGEGGNGRLVPSMWQAPCEAF